MVFAVTRLVIRLTWVPGLSITAWSGTTIRAMWLKFLHSFSRQSLWWMWRCVLRAIKYMHIGLFSLRAAHIFRYLHLYWYFCWKWIVVFRALYLLFVDYILAFSHAFISRPTTGAHVLTVNCIVSLIFIQPVYRIQRGQTNYIDPQKCGTAHSDIHILLIT